MRGARGAGPPLSRENSKGYLLAYVYKMIYAYFTIDPGQRHILTRN